jgi:hypothetical protein
MAFAIEWLDEAAREKSGANVSNWLVDTDRDIAMWFIGKHWQERAEGDISEIISLRIGDKKIIFHLMPAAGFHTFTEGQVHEYVWDRILSCDPIDMHGLPFDDVVAILKDGLAIRGGGWHINQRHPDFKVLFKF